MSNVDSGDSPSSYSAYCSPQQGTLISAIVFTFFAITLTVSLLYILSQQNHQNPSIDNTNSAAAAADITVTTSSSHENDKLKPEVLALLPVFIYSVMPQGEKGSWSVQFALLILESARKAGFCQDVFIDFIPSALWLDSNSPVLFAELESHESLTTCRCRV